MKMTVVGCGNAFSYRSGHQSFLLEEEYEGEVRYLQVDVGARIPQQMYNLGLLHVNKKVDYYISHDHGDHVGGLDEMLLGRYDWQNFPRRWDDYLSDSFEVEVFTRNGKRVTEKVKKDYWKPNTYKQYAPKIYAHEVVLEHLWNKTLSGALETTQGFTATLETFAEPVPLKDNEKFTWQGWTFEPIQQIHIVAGTSIKHAFGLLISKSGHKTLYLTTDTQYLSPEQMDTFYHQADIIIQDSEFVGINCLFKEGQECFVLPKDLGGDNFPLELVGKTLPWPTDKDDIDGMKRLTLTASGITPFKWKRFLFSSKVHASYAKLAGYDSANATKLPASIKAKMWLSHYQDFVLDNKDMYGNVVDWDATIREDGFAGKVTVGQVFEI